MVDGCVGTEGSEDLRDGDGHSGSELFIKDRRVREGG